MGKQPKSTLVECTYFISTYNSNCKYSIETKDNKTSEFITCRDMKEVILDRDGLYPSLIAWPGGYGDDIKVFFDNWELAWN